MGRVHAAADTAFHAAGAEHVERGNLLGDPDRVGERQQGDGSAEAHRRRAGGDRGQEQHRGGQDRGLGVEVLFGRPDRFETETLGHDGLLDRVAVALHR